MPPSIHAHVVISTAIGYAAAGLERPAVRFLLQTADDWIRAERLDDCADLLRVAWPERLGVTGSLGLLAALHPVRAQTAAARAAFVQRFREFVEDTRPADAAALMAGVQ